MNSDLILGTYESPAGDSSGKVARTRRAWAEVLFQHMRELRYGISPCKDCGKELLLDAQWQAIEWQREKKVDDAEP